MSELQVAWSGALERQGHVDGLSRYQGRSHLVGAFEREEQPKEPPHGWRSPTPGKRIVYGSLDPEVRKLLKLGWGPERIGRHLGCSPNVAYRVRRQGVGVQAATSVKGTDA